MKIIELLLLSLWISFPFGKFQTIAKSNNESKETASLIFVGDISFDGPIRYFVEERKSCDYKYLFKQVKPFLSDADLRIGNLECPLLANDSFNVGLKRKSIHHYGSIKAVEGLKYAGFDMMKVANNHFADYGADGMKSTMDTLRNAGIKYVGVADRKRNNEQKPIIKNINGIKIGFLAYCQQKEGCDRLYAKGAAVFDRDIARREIKKLKKSANIVAVLLHWSKELMPVPPKGIRDIANFLNLVGADLIIGDHPHVVQGHECIKRSIAVYSLGNFLFLRGFADSNMFLKRTPTEKEVKEYLDGLKIAFNPTQFAYIFRVTLSRQGIVDADYLQVEIKSDPKTQCLQPTPVTGHWEQFCGEKDYFCYRFSSIHEITAETLDEETFQRKFANRECVLAGKNRVKI